MAKLTVYLDWNTYHKILQRCMVLTKKEGKPVTPYAYVKRAIMKALSD